MSNKDNLQRVLQEAFENHTEILREAQWERLEGAMVKKKKRRFFPFFILFSVICFTAGVTYFLTVKFGLKNTPEAPLIASSKKDAAQAIPFVPEQNTPGSDKSSQKNYLKQEPTFAGLSGQIFTPMMVPSTEPEIAPPTPELLEPTQTPTEETFESVEENPANSTAKENIFEEAKTTELIAAEENKKVEKEIETKTQKVSKFSFSLSGGLSKMNVKVTGIESPEKLHKDTRNLFEQSNQTLKSEFVSLGFDINAFPKMRLGFSTGLQFLRVANPVQIDYRLTEVPLWDSRHTSIQGYVTKSPQDALYFYANSTHYKTYIILPLRLNYSMPLNSKNEIGLSAGVNICGLASAKGKTLILNGGDNSDPGIVDLNRKMYRKFDAGFNAGIQYSHQVKNAWWAGIESIWQSNASKYNTGDGALRNKLQGYNLNFLLKYKI